MFSQLAADSDLGAANRANEVSPISELTDLYRFAKTEIAKLITGRTIDPTDLEVTSDLGLGQALETVHFKILCRNA